jgi:hypothetical protein
MHRRDVLAILTVTLLSWIPLRASGVVLRTHGPGGGVTLDLRLRVCSLVMMPTRPRGRSRSRSGVAIRLEGRARTRTRRWGVRGCLDRVTTT